MNINTKANNWFKNANKAENQIKELENAIFNANIAYIKYIVEEDTVNWDELPIFVQETWNDLIDKAKMISF